MLAVPLSTLTQHSRGDITLKWYQNKTLEIASRKQEKNGEEK